MKTNKKYTALKITTNTVDDSYVEAKLSHGEIGGAWYSRDYPNEEFDTEQEAIEHAYKQDKYGNWLILPIVRFDNF